MWNFHLFVIITTIVYYILLRKYKRSLRNRTRGKRQSRLVYLIFLPIVLYITYYFFSSKNAKLEYLESQNLTGGGGGGGFVESDNVSVSLMSSIYPTKSSHSSSF